jgi:hypothetical protein
MNMNLMERVERGVFVVVEGKLRKTAESKERFLKAMKLEPYDENRVSVKRLMKLSGLPVAPRAIDNCEQYAAVGQRVTDI